MIACLIFRIYIYPFVFLGAGLFWIFGVWGKNKRDVSLSLVTPFVIIICLMVAWGGLEKIVPFSKDLITGDREKKEGIEVLSVEDRHKRSSYRYLRLSDDPSRQCWAIGILATRSRSLVGSQVNAMILPPQQRDSVHGG